MSSTAGAVRPHTPVWSVGALCQAVADALEARFNPVTVEGEVTGFTRAASGHCYFSVRDDAGQLRCAMFRRAAQLLDFSPRDGDRVELRGRLTVYEPRGDLQLVVEAMRRSGAGSLFEQFLRLKDKLQAQGLFDPARKRPVPLRPRVIGLVTSPQAAALHDVLTALQRRAPHVPVLLSPAAVQGAQAPAELASALRRLYDMVPTSDANAPDVILLVRGGGAIEDLWAFNDEALAHTIVASPVPLVCGVGHETDFTIADFVADLRAPTPTAAAELACRPREAELADVEQSAQRLSACVARRLDGLAQRLDGLTQRMGRPSARMGRERLRLQSIAQRQGSGAAALMLHARHRLDALAQRLHSAAPARVAAAGERLARLSLRLELTNPQQVLERGYALLATPQGELVTRAAQTRPGQALRATLADGAVDLRVQPGAAS